MSRIPPRSSPLPALALAAFLAASCAGAQEAPIAACLFPTAALSQGEEAQRLADIVHQALAQSLEQLGVRILPDSDWQGALDGTPQERLANGRIAAEVADRCGARMAVVSLVHLEGRELSLDVKALDARSGRVVSSVYSTTLVGVAVLNRINDAVARLTPQLQSFINPEQQVEEVAPFVVEATLLSDLDGTKVSLGGVEPVGETEGGRLTLPFALYPVGTHLDLLEEKPGYHSARETIVLDRPRSEVKLQRLWPETRRLVYLKLTTGQVFGLGAGYRYYLTPDTLFLAGENYVYLQPAQGDAGGVAFHDDLGVLIGRYLLRPYDARFRFALMAGLGLILTKNQAPGLFTDFYLDLLSVDLEWNLPESIVFFRSDFKAALGIGNHLLDGMIEMNHYGPQLTLGAGRKL